MAKLVKPKPQSKMAKKLAAKFVLATWVGVNARTGEHRVVTTYLKLPIKSIRPWSPTSREFAAFFPFLGQLSLRWPKPPHMKHGRLSIGSSGLGHSLAP